MKSFQATILVALAVLTLLSPRAALANEAVARQHWERAHALAKLGDHKAAIREYQLSYEADPRPNRLYDIAQQHQLMAEAGSLQELREAAAFYQKYLKEKPNPEDKAQVDKMIAELQARIESAEAAERDAQGKPLPASPDKAPITDAPRANEVPAGALQATPDDSSPKRSRTWLWVTIGVGAAVVVGGAIGLGVGLTRSDAPAVNYGGTDVRF